MFLEEHQNGLEENVFLVPKKPLTHMKEKRLMPCDLFRKVKGDYQKLYNSGKWTANNMKDLRSSLSGERPSPGYAAGFQTRKGC
jgi:hypothetical protein